MIDCLILGDSLAVGVGQVLPECQTVARTGITSSAFVQTILATAPRAARTVVISLGVNDDASMPTLDTLNRMRQGIAAARVVWLLPGIKDDIRAIIRRVAGAHGDGVVDTTAEAGADHLHSSSAGYRAIAARVGTGGTVAVAWTSSFVERNLASVYRVPGAASGVIVHRPTPGLGGQPQLLSMGARPGAAYGAWPPIGVSYAAMPPKEFSFRAFAASPAP